MKVMAEAVFSAEGVPLNREIQAFLHQLDVERKVRAFDFPNGVHDVSYAVYVEYDSPLREEVTRFVRSLGRDVGFRYFFRFSDEEYESAPFYRMMGFGNTPQAGMHSDGSAYRIEVLCPSCGFIYREQIVPLVANTTRFKKKRPAAWIDGHRIVVSQRVADLLQMWDVTGCELLSVVHKGRGAGAPAYQVKPTSVLPPWGSAMRFLDPPHLRERGCDRCGRKPRIAFPLHFETAALQEAQDINITSDLLPTARYATPVNVISARLRRLILDSGLALDARYSEVMEEQHWQFEPVIVI